ncbi:MAG TPA: peptide chain release factor N(5)-glutamine methyltransferase [Candidatus Binatia bacterium]|nr:peptide chain release factor N(5)-glutamine methyltransferase [Candidatus Binatia bacterium]
MESQTPITTSAAISVSIQAVVRESVQCLIEAGLETARLDAETLLSHVLKLTKEQFVLFSDMPLRPEQMRHYEELLLRRIRREPVAYITGRQEFWSLDFRVTPDVLIPRPETERLVEITVGLAREFPENKVFKILDVGTGSGAIAVSLARELPSSMIWATDVSIEALEIARSNAARNGASERVRLLHGDLFEPVGEIAGRFDLIVSNPPYIRSAEIDALEPEVSLWEPRGALDGGVDGLDYYRRIAREASDHLAPNGAVTVEIGADMGKEVARLFAGGSCYTGVTVFQDYAGRDRVVIAKLAGKNAKSI